MTNESSGRRNWSLIGAEMLTCSPPMNETLYFLRVNKDPSSIQPRTSIREMMYT
jgi:hypothetical protein